MSKMEEKNMNLLFFITWIVRASGFLDIVDGVLSHQILSVHRKFLYVLQYCLLCPNIPRENRIPQINYLKFSKRDERNSNKIHLI